MKPEEIMSLFGYSEFSPEVMLLFKNLGIYGERPENSVCWRTYQSKTLDVTLVFKGKNNYNSDYGPINKAYTDSHDESVLEEINLGSHKGNTNYPYALPFDWVFSDTAEQVKKKIGKKAAESSVTSYGSYMLFNTEAFQYLTGFNESGHLIWIRIMPLELSFKKKRALTVSLNKQNKNINNSGLQQLAEIKNQTPVVDWEKRMQEGDMNFSAASISATDMLLKEFITNLINATEKKNAKAVYSATKKLVLGLNKLNDKYDCFIDTMERDELIEFLQNAIRLTGFVIDEGLDITEEWREW